MHVNDIVYRMKNGHGRSVLLFHDALGHLNEACIESHATIKVQKTHEVQNNRTQRKSATELIHELITSVIIQCGHNK